MDEFKIGDKVLHCSTNKVIWEIVKISPDYEGIILKVVDVADRPMSWNIGERVSGISSRSLTLIKPKEVQILW